MQLKRVYQHLCGSVKVRSRQVRQRVIFGVILTVLVAVLFFAFHAFSVSASTDSKSTDGTVQLNNAGPASIGIRYGSPSSPPKITQQQAIQLATTWLGLPLAHQATHIHALYVLFSDDQYYSTDARGQKNYLYENVPAWVVILEGLNLPGSGGGRPAHGSNQNTIKYNHEMNVVINAQSGEYMEAFTYR